MKLIKNSKDYAEALKRLEELMITNPPTGSKNEEELELLAFLVQEYEKRHLKIPPATPVEAIRFRLEQSGLNQQDLVPFIGSKSRVSEVLSGKRGLALDMVRRLHEGLGIPLKSLVQAEMGQLPERIEPSNYPVKEMFLRGFFPSAFGRDWHRMKDKAEEMLHSFFRGRENDPLCALNRQTTREKTKIDLWALHAWRCRVLDEADKLNLPNYEPDTWTPAFIKQLTVLSAFREGPLLVQKRLREAGIAMVIEEQLPGTHLDGAALWHPKGFPVIGLTLRFNRVDNFWFTLFHEIGHVVEHLKPSPMEGYLDTDIDSRSEKEVELEADRFALNAFIPEEDWDRLRSLNYADEIKSTAKKMAISPAIIAGRLRREANDYRKHRTLIGQGEVRKIFGVS
jgi:HTH-type transcriptional regulator/antitoxin HigA